MAVLAIAAAGAWLAPAGYAAIGWAVGSAIGSLLFPQNTEVQGPQQQLMDLRVTGTEYGQPIAWVQGNPVIAGQFWWNTDRRPTTITTSTTSGGGGKGGGGGSVTTTSSTTTYDMDALIGLTDNEIVGIARIWWDGELIWTNDFEATAESLLASANSGKWARLTVYSGASDQLPDPTYENAVGTENACAYRGRGTVFIQGLQLGQSGQIPNLTFEVVARGSIPDGILDKLVGTGANDVYYPAVDAWYACAPLAIEAWMTTHFGGSYQLSLLNLTSGALVVSIPPSSIGTQYSIQGVDENNNALMSGGFTTKVYRAQRDGTVGYLETGGPWFGGYGMIGENGNVWATSSGGAGEIYRCSAINWTSHACTVASITGGEFGRFLKNAAGIAGRVYGVAIHSGGQKIAYVDTATLTLTVLDTVPVDQVTPPVIGYDGNIYAFQSGGSGTLLKYDPDGTVLDTLALPTVGGYSYQVGLYDHRGFVWVRLGTPYDNPWTKIDTVTMEIVDTVGPGYPGHSNYTAMVGESTSGAPVMYGNGPYPGYGQIGFIADTIIKDPPSVAAVQSAVCLRSGLTAGQFDVTGLASISRTVRSLTWSQVSAGRQITELLMSAFFYDMVVSDKIYFRPRGGASVASIPFNDLGATTGEDHPEPLALRQGNDLELPSQIALTYFNVNNDYQPDTQYSDRLISSVAGSLSSVQMSLGMTESEAKAVADTMLLDQVSTSLGTDFVLLGNYCRLEPTDPVVVTGPDGSTFRLRLVKKMDSYPLLSFKAVLDDVSVLSSQAITSSDYTPSTVVVGPISTQMELLDIAILRDADDGAGFYGAIKGDESTARYPGAGIFKSADDVEYTRIATLGQAAVIGTCTTVLGDWTGARVFDEKNSVTVDVGDGTLASSTRTAILNNAATNAMLIGEEIIQFVTATLVSTGVYVLTSLLRGARGTEWAMVEHTSNERCVQLSSAGLARIAMQNNDLGLPRYYKGVTLGRAVSTATAETFTNNAVGLKPFSPFDLRASRDGSNNITFTWQRRTRLAVRMIGALGISVPLGEETESYEIDVYASGSYATVLRTISAATRSAGYTAAQQTADGLTPGNAVYARVYQRSAVVGRGYSLEAAA